MMSTVIISSLFSRHIYITVYQKCFILFMTLKQCGRETVFFYGRVENVLFLTLIKSGQQNLIREYTRIKYINNSE